MARRFGMRQRIKRAEFFARRVTEALPERSYPWWLLAQTILGAAAAMGTVDQHVGAKSDEAERLKEALMQLR